VESHVGEPGHPVADELLTTCVEIRVRPAEALRRLLGHEDLNGQQRRAHAANDPYIRLNQKRYMVNA
jgi:hypothetical protein